jgi:arsenate reductase-like glutaredoxin family protein
MILKMYGIANCDTVKKARKSIEAKNIDNFYSKILALNFTTLWKYYLIDFKSADSAQFVSETYWREVWQTSKGRLFIAHLTIAHEA